MVLSKKLTEKLKSALKYIIYQIIEIGIGGGFGFLLGAIIDNYFRNQPAGEYALSFTFLGIIIAIVHRNWRIIGKYLKTQFPSFFKKHENNQKPNKVPEGVDHTPDSDRTEEKKYAATFIPNKEQNELSEDEATKPESTVKIREEPFTHEDEILFEEFKEKHDFVAHSHAMLKVFITIKKFAKTKTTVLITGEPGTGKELVAKAVYNESKRDKKPFVIANCGAIPEKTIESTLFGFVDNYFPNIPKGKNGFFTEADGGTIFLDEIGDLPKDVQVKLLRVLESGEFNIVGDPNQTKVDVRVIAATNRDLEKRILENEFRGDFYSRVNECSIQMPPLSNRKNDVPQIAVKLFQSCLEDTLELDSNDDIQKLKQPFMENPKTFEVLKEKKWKYNVRTLKSHIKNVVVEIGEDLPSISLSDFKKVLNDSSYNFKQQKDSEAEDNIFRDRKYEEALTKYIESDYVLKDAAEKLGVHRDTETSRVNSAVLRVAHHVNFDLSKMPNILNEHGIIFQEEDTEALINNMTEILVKIIKQTIKKRDRKAYKPEDENLYLALIENRQDLVDKAKNK